MIYFSFDLPMFLREDNRPSIPKPLVDYTIYRGYEQSVEVGVLTTGSSFLGFEGTPSLRISNGSKVSDAAGLLAGIALGAVRLCIYSQRSKAVGCCQPRRLIGRDVASV